MNVLYRGEGDSIVRMTGLVVATVVAWSWVVASCVMNPTPPAHVIAPEQWGHVG